MSPRPRTGYATGFSGPREPLRRRPGGRLPPIASRGARISPELLDESRRRIVSHRSGSESSSGSGPERRLVERITMGWSRAEQARVEALGYEAYLEEQLGWQAIDDGPLEEVLGRAFPTLAMSPAQVYQAHLERPVIPIIELIAATLYRSVYSPRQLFERMAVFWSDHFNIDLLGGLGFLLKPTDDREVVRRHALGTFPELLWASAHSPAMLSYLTNDSNHRDHPNENYARELMEFHTLGAGSGYSERDVREVARCFTGWRFQGRAAGPALGRFIFDPAVHDTGSKRVLGRNIPAGGGVEDGEEVLRILAADRRTARFIAGKLLVYVWGYRPGGKLVSKVANAYKRTGGDIRAMLRVALDQPRLARADPKLKRPYHLVVSSLRVLLAEVENPRHALESLQLAGQLPFAWSPPNGYPDSRDYWSGLPLPRWNFAATLMQRKRSRVRIDLGFLDRGLPAAGLARAIDDEILGGTMSEETRAAVETFLGEAPPTPKRLRDAVGLALASPEFQEY